MATHSSILAWRLLMDRGAWGATAQGVANHVVGKSQSQLSSEAECSASLVTWSTLRWD